MRLCDSEEAVTQNLRDAGCDEGTIAAFLGFVREEKEAESLRLLKKQRSLLLDAVHREEKNRLPGLSGLPDAEGEEMTGEEFL